MLNPFPDLLIFSIFAPTLLRFAVAGVVLYMAWHTYERRGAVSQLQFPIVGRGEWIAYVAIGVEVLIGAALFFGYYTQIAALLAGIAALKGIYFGARYREVFPFPRSTYVLALIVCISLLLTGAGALAFDIPL